MDANKKEFINVYMRTAKLLYTPEMYNRLEELSKNDPDFIIEEIGDALYANTISKLNVFDKNNDNILYDELEFYKLLQAHAVTQEKRNKIIIILEQLYNIYKPIGRLNAIHKYCSNIRLLCQMCYDVAKDPKLDRMNKRIDIVCGTNELEVMNISGKFINEFSDFILNKNEIALLTFDFEKFHKMDNDDLYIFKILKEYWLGQQPDSKEKELNYIHSKNAITIDDRYKAMIEFRKPYITKDQKKKVFEIGEELLYYYNMFNQLS